MANLIYYGFLFLLVFVLRFFKLRREYKKDFRGHWKETFHLSLELMYTVSGVIIALIINVKPSYIPPILMGYVVFVIIASLLEMAGDEEFSVREKTIYHSAITCLIVGFTYYSYIKVIPNVDINGIPDESQKGKHYTVLIPYQDRALFYHISKTELTDLKFIYTYKSVTSSKDSAIIQAKREFVKQVKSMYPQYKMELKYNEEEIYVVEKPD